MSFHYSDPVSQLPSGKGFVRWYSDKCAVVAFQKEHLSDERIGNEVEADVTMQLDGRVNVSTNNDFEAEELSTMFGLIEETVSLMCIAFNAGKAS